MQINKNSGRIHPLVAAASVSVMLVSLVGVAAITGVLPTSHSSVAPTAAMPEPVTVATTAPEPAVVTPAAPADANAAADDVVNPPAKPAAAAASATHHHKATAPRVAKTAEPQPRTARYSEPAVAQYNEPGAAQYIERPAVAQAPQICDNCGRVEAVHAIQQQAQPSGVGGIAGAVLGGVLGNQVGHGNGKALATLAGAVGGGFAGNEVEKRTHTATTYQVRVRMEDGRIRTFPYNSQPHWAVGDRIKVVNGYLTPQG
jgi:outer membrane lipoprotein SlyB